MDKRPSSKEGEVKEDKAQEIDEVVDVIQEAEVSAEEIPATEDGKDKLSEFSKFRANVLKLGTDSQSLTKYVEIVMAAKSHLTRMG